MGIATVRTGLARSAASRRIRPVVTILAALSIVSAGQVIALSDGAGRNADHVGATAAGEVAWSASSGFYATPLPISMRITFASRPATLPAATVHAQSKTVAKKAVVHTSRPVASKPKPLPAPRPAPAPTYHGTNHVWIPSLGISRSVSWFSCSRTTDPANYVYRWGCAGANNVYLLGHAWGVFKPLHDAYYNGRLRKGMKVIYADGSSKVHTYSVIWWKVVAPTTAASWAWAAQSVPSMTLQTCLGSNSQYRLMVRLVRVA
jgi:hypothetical protein